MDKPLPEVYVLTCFLGSGKKPYDDSDLPPGGGAIKSKV